MNASKINNFVFADQHQHGAALLMMLFFIVVLSSTTSLALFQWRRAHDVSLYFANERQIQQMLHDGITWSADYLKQKQQEIVTPADNHVLGIPIKHEGISFGDQQATIQITAYDGFAALPSHVAEHGAWLHAQLPDSLRGRSYGHKRNTTSRADFWLSTLPEHLHPFPHEHPFVAKELWTDPASDITTPIHIHHSSSTEFISEETPATLSVHINPYNKGSININTCTRRVLEKVLEDLEDSDVLETLLTARDENKWSKLPQLPKNKQALKNKIVLVDTSTLYALHISIDYAGMKRQYWVCMHASDKPEVLQILSIDEFMPKGQ